MDNFQPLLDDIQALKVKISYLEDKRLEGAIIRSKSKFIKLEEGCNSFFLSLEKKKAERKTVTILKDENNCRTKDTNSLLNITRQYYSNLWNTNGNISPNDIENISNPPYKTKYWKKLRKS